MVRQGLNKVDLWAYQHQQKGSKTTIEEIRYDFQDTVKYYKCLLGKYLPDDRNARILDLPCGEGRFLFALKSLGYKNIYGLDIDDGRIAICLSLGLPAEREEIIEFLEKEKDGTISLIVSMDFLEHLEKEQVIDFVQIVNSKLVPGGRFIVRMPCADGFFSGRHVFNDFTHKWGATSGAIRNLLTAAGFDNVIVFGEDPILVRPRDFIRVPLCFFARFFARSFLFALGLSAPVIWSNSMWVVGGKK